MNLLTTYKEYTKDHESPSIYHLWVCISTIAAVLERKVWSPLMADLIYPNMYIILVAPPAKCRKGSCISMGSRLLKEMDSINLGSEKITPEALIRRLADCIDSYDIAGQTHKQCALTTVSKELASLGGRDIEYTFELLCDLYDAQINTDWASETIARSVDKVIGPWLNILGATVPSFFKKPEVQLGIGSGFCSRCIFLFAEEIRFRRSYIQNMPEHLRLHDELLDGLKHIHELVRGEFLFTEQAQLQFDAWYENLPKHQDVMEQLAAYAERKQTHLLKLCMIISAAEGGNNMTMTESNLRHAFSFLSMAEKYMPYVFSGAGRSVDAQDIERISRQIERAGSMTLQQIYSNNWQDVRYDNIEKVLTVLLHMRAIGREITDNGQVFNWLGQHHMKGAEVK